MQINTDEDYRAAVTRLEELGADLPEGPEQDEFFEINAAMVEYETRSHSALSQGDRDA